jgi:hypothetical protein
MLLLVTSDVVVDPPDDEGMLVDPPEGADGTLSVGAATGVLEGGVLAGGVLLGGGSVGTLFGGAPTEAVLAVVVDGGTELALVGAAVEAVGATVDVVDVTLGAGRLGVLVDAMAAAVRPTTVRVPATTETVISFFRTPPSYPDFSAR